MPESRALHSATGLRTNGAFEPTNRVLVVGGHNGTTVRNTAILYEPAFDGWVSGNPSTNLQVYAHTATQVLAEPYKDHVLVAGGFTSLSSNAATNKVHGYNPAGGGNWSWNVSNSCVARAWHTATDFLGVVDWVGGEHNGASLANSCLWQPGGNSSGQLNWERSRFATRWVPGGFFGSMLAVGGWRSQANPAGPIAEVESGF